MPHWLCVDVVTIHKAAQMKQTYLTKQTVAGFLSAVLAFMLAAVYPPSAAATQLMEGPQYPAEHETGYYSVGDERVKFFFATVEPHDWQSKGELAELVKPLLNRKAKTHVWDDEWYWTSLPSNRNKVVLLVWWNYDAHELGWVAIKNTLEQWYVRSNDSPWTTVRGGRTQTYSWHTNGRKIDIDLKNPLNRHGWTEDDIWYSFGY
jgi:hypothetical protein